MTGFIPKKAFVLAAGMGQRMRPLTDACPKPMLMVDGKTMLDRTLDALEAVGVEDVVVNTFYLAPIIEEHLKSRTSPNIIISRESDLLDTGGGVKNMIDFFGDEPFFVLNADIVWVDGSIPTLQSLINKWDASKMDLLLLLHDLEKLPDYKGGADYYLDPDSDTPVFAKNADQPGNYVFTGPRIVHPKLFEGVTEKSFSFLKLFHKAEAMNRLSAVRHLGEWYHVGTPEALDKTNNIFLQREERKVAL